jgi:hypothetical protein
MIIRNAEVLSVAQMPAWLETSQEVRFVAQGAERRTEADALPWCVEASGEQNRTTA